MHRSFRFILSIFSTCCILSSGASSAAAAQLQDSEPSAAPAEPDYHPLSCQNVCGGTFIGMCWCDDECADYEDCCPDYERECKAPKQLCGTRGAKPCQSGSFCNFPEENECGRTDKGGTCLPIPSLCTEQYEPVCGCDGRTYANPCFAQRSGMSVASKGPCEADAPQRKCVSSDQCSEGQWCNTAPCLSCDPGPDNICPAVCHGYCEPLPKSKKLCMAQQDCEKGYFCDDSVCLSGCGNNPGIICPAVCFGECKPTPKK